MNHALNTTDIQPTQSTSPSRASRRFAHVFMVAGTVSCLCATPLLAQYTNEQVTAGGVNHRHPSINNPGEIVWAQDNTVNGWEIFSSTRGQLTFPSGDYTEGQWPSLADDGSYICFRSGSLPCVGSGFLLRYPGETTVEFCSRNVTSGAHRDTIWQTGISSDGTKMFWAYKFYSTAFTLQSQKYFLNGAQVSPGSISTWNYPAVNNAGEYVYEVGGTVISSTRGALVAGAQPAINDAGDIAYVVGSEVRVRLASGVVVTVGTGADPTINNARVVAFEQSVGGNYQIVRGTPYADLIPVSLDWNLALGGVDFRYGVQYSPLDVATTAELFWARGTNISDIVSSTPLFTHDIQVAFVGTNSVVNAPASAFANRPAGATHVLLVLDYDNLVHELDKLNNVAAIEVATLERVDAMTFQQAGVLPTDPAQYFSGGQLRVGAVADGASRLVLRVNLGAMDITDPTLNLHFTLSGGGSHGRLRPLSADTWSYDVPAALHTQGGVSKAFCIFESPEDFPASTPAATVQFLNGSTLISKKQIEIRRPPVVLVHGIWSNPRDAFAITGAKAYIEARVGPTAGGFPVGLADYGVSSSEEFNVNAPVVFNCIQQVIQTCYPDYACSRADVVGHSMGALLSRIAMQRYGPQPGNYNKGNIHKLISIGTPHRGSFLADQLILARRDSPRKFALIANLMALKMKYVDRGAADNLSAYLGYSGIPDIGQVGIPCHAIVSNCDNPAGLRDDLLDLYTALFIIFPESDPRRSTSDAVVEMSSQADGIASGSVTRFLSTAQHTLQTSSQAIQARIFRLLEAPIASSGWFDANGFTSFAGVTMPSPSIANILPDAVAAAPASDTVGTWLVVTGLFNGQSVQPNDVITVTAFAADGRPLQGFALIGGTDVIEMTAEPFSLQFSVPQTATGDLPLMAIASDANGEPSVQFITLRVQPNAALESLFVEPSSIQMRLANRYQLRVLGRFSDGLTRDITSAAAGTMYGSSDQLRVRVDTNGMVSAIHNTTTEVTISVTNGVISTNVQTTVNLMNLPPTAHISADSTNASGRAPISIQFDGSASSDPESAPLAYNWDFGDGTKSDRRAPARHTFSVPGEYVVRLVVSDPEGLNGTSEFRVKVVPAVLLEIRYMNSQPLVTLFGEPGIQHVLESSTNLQNWRPLMTNALSNGAFDFLDTNTAPLQQRFFRGLRP